MGRWRGRKVGWPVLDGMRMKSKMQWSGSGVDYGHRSDEHSCGVAANHPLQCGPAATTLRAIHDGPVRLQVATQTRPTRPARSWAWYVPAMVDPPRASTSALRQGRHRPSHPPPVHNPIERNPARLSVHHSQPAILPARGQHACRNQNSPKHTASRTCRRAPPPAPHHTPDRITNSIDTTNLHTQTANSASLTSRRSPWQTLTRGPRTPPSSVSSMRGLSS